MSTNTHRSQKLGSVFASFFIGAGLILVTQGALLVGIGLVLIGVVALAVLARIRPAGGHGETIWRLRKRARSDSELPMAEGEGSQHVSESDRRRLPIPKPQTALGGIVETVVIVLLALVLALGIQAWLVKPYGVSSGSMEPTLQPGGRYLVNRFIYHFEDPGIGDIAVFHPPAGAKAEGIGGKCGVEPKDGAACPVPVSEESSEHFIKRIVAGPGDRLQIIHGQAIVNGEASEAANAAAQQNCDNSIPIPRLQKLQTAAADGWCNFPTPILIPPDHYFVMGDNRAFSSDSRFWGPIPREWIIGKAFVTYWPPDRWGFF